MITATNLDSLLQPINTEMEKINYKVSSAIKLFQCLDIFRLPELKVTESFMWEGTFRRL